MIIIRHETAHDHCFVEDINKCAFGKENEARLVNAIRNSENFIPRLSLVAVMDCKVVGHCLLSTIYINCENGNCVEALSLAPVAVAPEYQNQGIGSRLVERGLEIARCANHRIVVVVGHPEFYTRFGFSPARTKGLEAPFPVPDPAFMVCELEDGCLNGVCGMVTYPPAFDDV